MKSVFTAKVLFLSCAIVGFSYASQKGLADYQADAYLRNLSLMDKQTKAVHRAIRSLANEDMDRIQIINRGGARDLRVYGKQMILRTFGNHTVNLVRWSNLLSHQQIECFISAFEYIRHKK